MGTFEFVAVAALRAAQLARGCRPKVDGDHTRAVFAQLEVAEGKLTRAANATTEGQRLFLTTPMPQLQVPE